MKGFITAKEARRITDKVNEYGTIAVYDLIEKTIDTGKSYVLIDFPLSNISKLKLQEKGFKIEDLSESSIHTNDLYHKVSW